MKCFVLIACCVQLALSLPQGYNYKDAGPVDLNLGGFKPVGGPGAPCNHGPNGAGLVQQQSIGRIIHHGSGHGDSQDVTVNSHITVGDGGHSHTQTFQNGIGYVEQGRPAPISLQQGPHLPLPGPAPSFLQNTFGSSSSFSQGGHGVGRIPITSSQGLSGGYSGGFVGGKFSGSGSAGFAGPRPQYPSAPQINSNFISGGSGHNGGGSFIGSGSGSSFGGFNSGSQFQSGFSHQQQHSGGFSHGSASSQSFGQAGNFGGNGILNGALGNVIRETFANAPLDPTIEKHIYVHVPPEDLEEKETRQQIRTEAAAKKHYKIIFIKAPTVSQPTNYAQIANAAGVSEEKTIVYVLVKKPEEPSYEEIQQIQQTTKPSKPEVYFIKYKTRNDQQGGAGGFIGGSYNSNIEQSSAGGHQQIETIGGNQFAGSDIAGGVDIRGNGAGSSIESSHQDGATFLTTGSGSSSSSSSISSSSAGSFSTGSAGVNIGETGPRHELYGVPAE